jgi:hypothetical protein
VNELWVKVQILSRVKFSVVGNIFIDRLIKMYKTVLRNDSKFCLITFLLTILQLFLEVHKNIIINKVISYELLSFITLIVSKEKGAYILYSKISKSENLIPKI